MNRPVRTLIVSICGSKLYLVIHDFLNGWFVLLASSGVIGLAGTVRAAIVPYLWWFWSDREGCSREVSWKRMQVRSGGSVGAGGIGCLGEGKQFEGCAGHSSPSPTFCLTPRRLGKDPPRNKQATADLERTSVQPYGGGPEASRRQSQVMNSPLAHANTLA
jgi:hypothetical protein